MTTKWLSITIFLSFCAWRVGLPVGTHLHGMFASSLEPTLNYMNMGNDWK